MHLKFTKRRKNPQFDHAAHQLKSKRAAEKKWLRNKTQADKEKYQQINKAYKAHL